MFLNPSIFGVEAPKFLDALDSEVEILLDHFVITKDEPDFGTIMRSSIINRHREWVDKGDHWIFEGYIHLFKYVNPEAFYLSLVSYLKQNVLLYRRRDGEYFINAELQPVFFRLDKLEPIHLYNNKKLPDVLLISFKSIEPLNGVSEPLTTFYEDFNDGYDTDLFERALYNVEALTTFLSIKAGGCVTCTAEEVARYSYMFFRMKKRNIVNTSIIVTADLRLLGASKHPIIGFYDTTKYFAGIAVQSSGGSTPSYTIRLRIANGNYPAYLLDEILSQYNGGIWNQYRVVWNAKTKTVYFYIRPAMTGVWVLINNQGYEVPEFEGRTFKPGVQGTGITNNWNPDGELDNLYITFNPQA